MNIGGSRKNTSEKDRWETDDWPVLVGFIDFIERKEMVTGLNSKPTYLREEQEGRAFVCAR